MRSTCAHSTIICGRTATSRSFYCAGNIWAWTTICMPWTRSRRLRLRAARSFCEISSLVKSCDLPPVQRVQHQRLHFGYDLRVILIGFGLRAIFGNSLAERVLQDGGGEWNSGPGVGRNRESFRHIVSGEKIPVNLFWIEGLDHRGFIVRGVAAVFSENLSGDVIGQNPPIDDERVDFIFERDVLGELLKDGNLWAVAVEDDDVLETVVY